jgi:hypothetical protein
VYLTEAKATLVDLPYKEDANGNVIPDYDLLY